MATWLPVPLLIFTVGALILVDERAQRKMGGAVRNLRWVMVWKPLSSLLLILIAALSFTHSGSYNTGYSILILVGLLLSLAGDVLLIFPSSQAFLAGLVAFLCAHLAYIGAFVLLQLTHGSAGPPAVEIIAALVLFLIAVAVFRYLRPRLGSMRLPVIVYMLVISVMVHRAVATAAGYPIPSALPVLMVAGALLFYLSDAILAINRFGMGGTMPHGHLLSLSTYYAGQLLLALSTAAVISSA